MSASFIQQAIKKYPIYTRRYPGPNGEVDCNMRKSMKLASRTDYIKKLKQQVHA